jgi:hypothetical protein
MFALVRGMKHLCEFTLKNMRVNSAFKVRTSETLQGMVHSRYVVWAVCIVSS